jgi:hypothetical protein
MAKYAVIKTYEVEATSEKHAQQIIEALEGKNMQHLFLRLIVTREADKPKPIWQNWLS